MTTSKRWSATIAATICGGICAGLLLVLARWSLSPWSQVPTDAIVVIVDDSCGGSKDFFKSYISTDMSPAKERYWFVALSQDTPFAASVCEHLLDRLDNWRTRMLPVSFQCILASADARAFLAGAPDVGLPAIRISDTPASADQARLILNDLGAILGMKRSQLEKSQ